MPRSPIRIALLSYRAHPEVGGQGVYVRHLSAALNELGHAVTVFAGQPYPDLLPGTGLVRVPSLDLYRPEDPFRRPAKDEIRDLIDIAEYAAMCTGAFPEPLTFSIRAARELRKRAGQFDLVHDNQTLAYGILDIAARQPVVTTVHHPISIDRRMELAGTGGLLARIGKRRWYSFVRMQGRVARRSKHLLSVSEQSREDVVREFAVAPERVTVIPNGVDAELFRPLPEISRVPGRLVTVASSASPGKGMGYLLESVAKLVTERDVELIVIGRGGETPVFWEQVRHLGISQYVRALGRVDALTMVETFARAEIAIVPSLYEGFSLPAVEAMAMGIPLVATTGGALGEVVGPAGVLVPPADAGAMKAAIADLLDDDARRTHLGRIGRTRALERFTWRATAMATAALYEKAIRSC
ncbi:MAG: glycosyltransferase family 4 protein [Actinomycetota bacterium]